MVVAAVAGFNGAATLGLRKACRKAGLFLLMRSFNGAATLGLRKGEHRVELLRRKKALQWSRNFRVAERWTIKDISNEAKDASMEPQL